MTRKMMVGPFELVTQIGKGAMGVVWEAVHSIQDVHVAIKFLTLVGAQDESFRQAFANEVSAVARLNHPSIIRILDYGVTDRNFGEVTGGQIAGESQYYVTELATGGTLPRPTSPLPWRQMKFLLLELLDALAHAHARNVIHRDIKPGNILLMQKGDYSRIMLTDFGIAKAVGVSDLLENVVAGTPRYMAPEQVLNEVRDQGPWTDLYSLGCIAYQFATGRKIFAHASGGEVLRCQVNEVPEPVVGDHLPEGFQDWLSRMLAKNVMDRYGYAAEAAWDLASLPDPLLERPDGSETLGNRESDDHEFSGGHEASSKFFESLYRSKTSSVISGGVPISGDGSDIADDLLEDMGDTLRMEASEVAEVMASGKQSERKPELSTLSEMYRQVGHGEHGTGKGRVLAPETWRVSVSGNGFGNLLGAGLGLWGLRPIPMIGREKERDEIYSQLMKVREDGIPRAVFMDGLRGTGKSRICEWMSQRFHELSLAHVLKANHYEDHLNSTGVARAIMYYMVCENMTRHEALDRIKWILKEHPLVPEYDDALPLLELMRLPDDPMHVVPNIHFSDIREQFDVLIRCLKRLSHDRAIVLWLDDIHYSSYSIEFVQYLLSCGKTADLPVLVLATVREEDLKPETAAETAYRNVLSIPGVLKLDIEPLSDENHIQLVREMIGLDEGLCSQVALRTSGMPLFAIQLVGDWVERGVLVLGATGFHVREGESVELPDSLHDLWLSRIRLIFKDTGYQEYAIRQLEIAAALGAQFDADEWRIACEIAEIGSISKILESMITHRLFESQYPKIRFVHNLMWESMIRHSKEEGRYCANHMICADMLKDYFSGALEFYNERYSEHMYESGAYALCIEPMLNAAVLRRCRSEYEIAHRLLQKREHALNLVKADENSPIRGFGWIEEANVYLQEVRLDEAEPIVRRSVELGEHIQYPVISALANKAMGLLLHLRNNLDESLEAFKSALFYFDQINGRRKEKYLNDRAETLWLIGRVCDVRHELELACNYMQQAIQIQDETNDQYGLARSYKALGNIFQHDGKYEEAGQNLEYALQLFEQLGYRLYIANCLNDIGEIYRLGYVQPEQAEVYYRRAMDLYREINELEGCTTVINLVLLLISKQRYTEAKSLVLSQIDRMERAGQTFDLNWLYAELLTCCAATFDWPMFDDIVTRLGKMLDESMVVDADILYCTELAANLSDRFASREYGKKCRDIAYRQAVRLNDNVALERLSQFW